jgi:hypothetical protein
LPTPPEAPISYLGSLTEQIDSISTLNYEQQCAILTDLRRGLRDPNTANDVEVLLDRFRRRKDLLVTIADEIDSLIKTSPDPDDDPPDIPNPPPPTPEQNTRRIGRRKGILILGLAALVIHTVTWICDGIVTGPYFHIESIVAQINHLSFYILILGGAIAGAICGKNIRSICLSSLGLLVFPCWAVLIIQNYPQQLILYDSKISIDLSVTAGIMAIAGSIIGVFLTKRKALKTTTAKATS